MQRARQPAARCSSSASGPATPTSPSATRSSPPTASTPTSRRPCSRCPTPPVMVELLDRWDEQRKSARVLLVIDVSGSMGDPATPRPARPSSTWPSRPPSTRSTSSRTTTRSACASSPPTSGPAPSDLIVDLACRSADRPTAGASCAAAITRPAPRATARRSTTSPRQSYDDAVDGLRPHPDQRRGPAHRRRATTTATPPTTSEQLDDLLAACASGTEGQAPARSGSSPSPTARTPTSTCSADRRGHQRRRLRRQRPATIDQVFTAVVSNF